MGLLDFLVTSKTRRNLLRLLFGQDVVASGNQLAKLVGAAYSLVHSELEAMRKESLVRCRKEGRAVVFRKNDKYPERKVLENLLDAKKQSVGLAKHVGDQSVRLNLARFGAPMSVEGESENDLSLEETLVLALSLSRRDATVARTLPLVVARNADRLDLPRLEYLARKQGVLPVLGFFLDMTGSLARNPELLTEARRLMDRRRKRMESFFVQRRFSEFEKRLAEINTPPVARSWHFLMNMGMDSFESLFQKHLGGVERP
jgi:hypothetical protein